MATTEKEIFERARLARDLRFDGRFYIGVKTTGIYCRPICPANPPRSENVAFYPTAAAAAEAGFRPCLRCRPETAPGTPAWFGTSTTVQRGLRLIANGELESGNIESLSDRLGVSSRHLRRLFRKHLGASPIAVAHTQRLHFAKQLLDESQLPLNQVAIAAGFGSVRRFNDAFRNSYGRTPRELRKLRTNTVPGDQAAMSVTLTYRRPFDWSTMLRYFSERAIPGVEVIHGQSYSRSIRLGDSRGILEICPADRREALQLTFHGVETRDLFHAVNSVRTMLDLDAPVEDIKRVLNSDPDLSPRLRNLPGVRVPGAWDGFELSVRTILGQQVSVAGASTMTGRLVETYGEKISDPIENKVSGPGLLFPSPRDLLDAPLEVIGIIRSRASAIRSLALATVEGAVSFDTAQDPVDFMNALTAIKGIGDWTGQYLSMRVLRNPDAFPASDLGLRKAIDPTQKLTPKELQDRARNWRPWRAYAAMLLWQGPDSSGG
jgi:AraC family transcriptional regulator of adaptative response / DNA-3-methyladenine glycosylase II